MELGKTIRRLRLDRGWAIDDLAAYLDEVKGGDRTGISKIENGQRWPRPEMLQALADAFNMRVYQLFALAEGVTLPVAGATPDERKLLENLNAMTPELRTHILAITRKLV